MRNRRPFTLLVTTAFVATAVLAACSGAGAMPSPTITPTQSAAPSAAPSSETPPSAEPSTNPTAEPSQASAADFTSAEQALLDQIRPDARTECAPRRTDLPEGASAGVECRPSGGPASQVGFYAFPTDQDAARAYFARLAANGVKPMSGNCDQGQPGDAAWTPGDGDPGLATDEQFGVVIDGNPYIVLRHGCYVAEGTANVRATCGNGVYVGVLGRTDDVAELVAWAEQNAPDVEVAVPSVPGICYPKA